MIDSTTLIQRITIDSAICHGKPCIRGLRYPVEMILELLSSGMTSMDIMADYPDLELEDILATLAFAARLIRFCYLNNPINCCLLLQGT